MPIENSITPSTRGLVERRLRALFDEAVVLIRKAQYNVLKNEDEAIKRERVILWVQLGVVLNTYQPVARRSLRDVHYELKQNTKILDFNSMYRSMCIAARFNNDIEEFKKWYIAEGVYISLSAVYRTLFMSRRIGYQRRNSNHYYNPLDTAMSCIDDMAVYANRNQEAYDEMAQKLTILRQYIDARMPVVVDFNDDTFFRYSPCCSCGKHPGATDGYELYEAQRGDIRVLVPMCTKCLEGREDVNWARVSQMYFLFSLASQNELDKHLGVSYNAEIGDGIYHVEV